MKVLPLLLAISLPACAPDGAAGPPGFAPGAPEQGLDPEDEPTPEAAPQDDDDSPDDDDATAPDEDPWDPSPPEAAAGDRVTGRIRCGWLTSELDVGWAWTGSEWLELPIEGASEPRPELQLCFEGQGDPADNHRLRWHTDGTMYFEAGGLEHDLAPGIQPWTWFGEVRPIGGPSEACLAAVEAVGLELPVIMQLLLDPPDGA